MALHIGLICTQGDLGTFSFPDLPFPWRGLYLHEFLFAGATAMLRRINRSRMPLVFQAAGQALPYVLVGDGIGMFRGYGYVAMVEETGGFGGPARCKSTLSILI